MMKVFEFKAYVYADSEEEVKALEKAMNSFVQEHRNDGRAVTATKVTEALGKWKDNPIVRSFIINYFK